jgi:hypothetical protein
MKIYKITERRFKMAEKENPFLVDTNNWVCNIDESKVSRGRRLKQLTIFELAEKHKDIPIEVIREIFECGGDRVKMNIGNKIFNDLQYIYTFKDAEHKAEKYLYTIYDAINA